MHRSVIASAQFVELECLERQTETEGPFADKLIKLSGKLTERQTRHKIDGLESQIILRIGGDKRKTTLVKRETQPRGNPKLLPIARSLGH